MSRTPGALNKDRPYRDALRMELADAGLDLKKLRKIAAKHIAACERGDMQAIKELADRLDGKPSQAVESTSEVAHRYVIEVPPVLTGEAWEQKYGRALDHAPLDDAAKARL